MHKTHAKLKWQHGVPHTDCANVGSKDEYIDIDFKHTSPHIQHRIWEETIDKDSM